MTRRYRRLVAKLGITTTFHKLRHYSATELIAAGVDLRTVAGRLGHADGGTTLAFYTAWIREADQRASMALLQRLPIPANEPVEVSVPRQRQASPHEHIAHELRVAIGAGRYPVGDHLPTVTQLAATYGVAPSTAHRAITQLATEHLIVVTRGKRATVARTARHS